MSRRVIAVWIAGGIATGMLLAALGWGLVHAAKQANSVVGNRVPDITILSLDGKEISLRTWVGMLAIAQNRPRPIGLKPAI